MRATSGKSLFTETLYVAQIIRYVIVYGISLRSATSPQTLIRCCGAYGIDYNLDYNLLLSVVAIWIDFLVPKSGLVGDPKLSFRYKVGFCYQREYFLVPTS